MAGEWTVTDPDTNQQGRHVGGLVYEFKEKGRDQEIIDLGDYSGEQIRDIMEEYGYANLGAMGDDPLWILAECFFESGL